jgi:Tfp pilus assembly protein PilV
MEVQIALVVITFFLLSTAQLLILSQSVQNRYKDHIRIMSLISEQLEYLRSLPFSSPEVAEGFYTDNLTELDSVRVFRINWTISDISPRLKSIDISCFPEGYKKRETKTILYLSSDLEF